MRLAFSIILLLVPSIAFSDGYMFDPSGRFPEAEKTEFQLTDDQIYLIDYYYLCRTNSDNTGTPYIFKLTEKQSEELEKSSGLSPSYFAISSSYNGDAGSELKINIVNRFKKNRIEIPHSLLTSDSEAEEWAYEIIGWSKENRFKSIDSNILIKGECKNT